MSELIKAIRDIAEVDPLARRIVNRSFSGFESIASAETETEDVDALIKRLVETIEYQERIIDRMSERFTIVDDPESIAKFKAALGTTPIPMLRTLYDRAALRQYVKETRFLICSALIELSKETGKEPSPIWLNVYAHNGEFGDE
jgi:hypothetical protein